MSEIETKIANFEHFFDLSLDLYCIAGTDGYYKFLNGSWERLLGYSLHELKSRPYLDFVVPEDFAPTQDVSHRLKLGENIVHFENRYRCKNGEIKCIQWVARFVPNSTLIYAVARDVTEQKLADERLLKTKQQLRLALDLEKKARSIAEKQRKDMEVLFSQLPALVAVLKGPKHEFELANEYFRKMIGGRDPVGKTIYEVFPYLGPNILGVLNRVYSDGERFVGEEYPILADWVANGEISERIFTFVYEPTRDFDGQINGIWIIAFDLTEAKSLKAKLEISERMAPLGILVAGVAHEMNTPLAYATMNIRNILEHSSELDSDTLRMLNDTEEGLFRVADIVNSLKTVSRQDPHVSRTLLEVESCIRAALKFANNEIRHRARLVTQYDKTPAVFANGSQLTQVFLNLLMNSAQAIPPGSAHLHEIRVETSAKDGQVVIKISDSGNGINPQDLPKIFDPFFTTKPMGEGTGLGLSLCHGIITGLGGAIKVASEIGKTVFEVSIPYAVDAKLPAPVRNQTQNSDKILDKIQTRYKILIVDDEKRLLDSMSLVLVKDHDVTTVSSGREAMDLLTREGHFDLIICDLMMPEKTGINVYLEATNLKRGLEGKFIFMTGGVFTSEAEAFFKIVPNQKLHKPFSANDLRTAIRNWRAD